MTAALSHPEVRRYLEGYVRRRVPEADADDAIQSVLCAALEAKRVPDDREEVRKWLTGIARRKIAALYEKSARERIGEPPELGEEPTQVEMSSLLRWAERQANESESCSASETLEWMARESDGEKLEAIAEEARLPAARVRQRVSRLRRFMKTRWIAELAVAGLLAIAIWISMRSIPERRALPLGRMPSVSVPHPRPSPLDWAREARRQALVHCDHAQWSACLRGLDEAARLDPAGDVQPSVESARQRARAALSKPPFAPAPPPRPIGTTTPYMTTPTGTGTGAY